MNKLRESIEGKLENSARFLKSAYEAYTVLTDEQNQDYSRVITFCKYNFDDPVVREAMAETLSQANVFSLKNKEFKQLVYELAPGYLHKYKQQLLQFINIRRKNIQKIALHKWHLCTPYLANLAAKDCLDLFPSTAREKFSDSPVQLVVLNEEATEKFLKHNIWFTPDKDLDRSTYGKELPIGMRLGLNYYDNMRYDNELYGYYKATGPNRDEK